MTEQELIDDGAAVSAFLASDAGQRIREETGKIIYNKWRLSKTTAERELAYAESEAFNTLFAVMENTATKGVNAEAQRTRRLKLEAQQEALYPKKK